MHLKLSALALALVGLAVAHHPALARDDTLEQLAPDALDRQLAPPDAV